MYRVFVILHAVPVVAVPVCADDLVGEVAVVVVVVVQVVVGAQLFGKPFKLLMIIFFLIFKGKHLVSRAPAVALVVLGAVLGIREGEGDTGLVVGALLVDLLDDLLDNN